MKLKLRTLLRIILAASGTVLLTVAVLAAVFDRFHEGSVALILLGGCFIAISALYSRWHGVMRWVSAVFCGGALLMMALCLALCLCPVDNLTYNEDAIIVLGLEMRSQELPDELKCRLDTAAEYHKKNPDALIVLSGGGSGVSQSSAMREYLINKGVSPSSLTQENASCNTYENFLFSKKVISSRLGNDCRIGFITSNYHLFRSQQIAESLGLSPAHGGCATPAVSFFPNCVRELMAIARFWLLGY
jgi:uncharacterized SAM-binding protein YcdF (DUF218 family)